MTNEFEAQQQPDTSSKYRGSIYTSIEYLPDDFVKGVRKLEKELEATVWMLIQQNENTPYGWISPAVYKGFFDQRSNFPDQKPLVLLLKSYGGDPSHAYRLANLFIKHCRGFLVFIPNFAKSAATLLALGANSIVLAKHAELGPIDMQVPDEESEMFQSALNQVQALERLGAYSKTTLDEIMLMLLTRTGKKINTVLPHAIDFTASIVRPLMEKIDVVKYSEMSRLLKIGEDYAERLLRPKYGRKAAIIAKTLVAKYPEHGFVIDSIEAETIGLEVELPQDGVSEAFLELSPFMDNLTVHGCLQEVKE